MAQMIELQNGEVKIPEWTQGETYKDGTVVSYNGSLCVTHEGLPQTELSVNPVREIQIIDRNTGNYMRGTFVVDLDGSITLSTNLQPLLEQYIAQEVDRRVRAQQAMNDSTFAMAMHSRFEIFKRDVFDIINEHTNINITEEEFMALVQ